MRPLAVHEVRCKSALNRVQGMPFPWSLNPYRGCTHGCHYCYARASHRYLNLDGGDTFSSVLLVKTNFADVLRRELSAPSWKRESVSLGTATDPYQPLEGRYRISRATLAALLDFRTPVSIVTKSTLVWRDLDVLQALNRSAAAKVCISVPTVDADAWRATEPGTPAPAQRLRVLERLTSAGIEAGVLMAPLLPGISTDRAQIEATVRAAAEHGACFLWTGLLHVDAGVRDHFLGFLRDRYPHLLDGYLKLYAGKYARPDFAARVDARAEAERQRWGLGKRYVVPETAPAARQLSLL
jgi:DNA repair photolyase